MSERSGGQLAIVEPGFQHYAWGDPQFIPRLYGLEGRDRPYAEAWFGAHAALPSMARVGDRRCALDELLAADGPRWLGANVTQRFGGLPFLLKILAAADPLSIQVHPSRAQARAGFARENQAGIARDAGERCYKDDNHKPELIVALTEFVALCGFRPAPQIAANLAEAPELHGILPGFCGTGDSLRNLLCSYYAAADDSVGQALAAWVARLDAHRPRLGPDRLEYWVLEAHRRFSASGRPDRGLIFFLLLNLIELAPGQGLFLPAGVPHAYLRGAGIEVMASSDNVLRGGLTAKHVDVDELMRIIRFEFGPPPLVGGAVTDGSGEVAYATAADEFELRLLRSAEPTAVERRAFGPELLLVLEGSAAVDAGGARAQLAAGASCLVPAGTAYRLATAGAAQVVRVVVPEPGDEPRFRGRQPNALGFGTSGLRGRVEDITDLEAYVTTRGFLDYLIEEDGMGPGTSVALAGDLRPSTPRILRAVARAVSDAGFAAVYCGAIPTPALTAFAVGQGWPSIMVTGSHIPFDRNGIKFNKSSGEVLKTDEDRILAAIGQVRRFEYGRLPAVSLFADDGSLREPGEPTYDVDRRAELAYRDRYLRFVPPGALAGLRLVVYEHSAVGRDVLAGILASLGAQVHPMGRSAEFVAIDTEAISGERLAVLQELADRAAAECGAIDAVVSTDGDSDRPLLAGVDEAGQIQFIPGDLLGLITADYLRADAIAVPVSSTDAIEQHLRDRPVTVVRTRIGSPWVIAAMAELAGAHRVGWEANGGFLTASASDLDGRVLPPLPTRDAVLPIVAALHAARRRGARLGDLLAELPQRHSKAGLVDDVPVAAARALTGWFSPQDRQVRAVEFGDQAITWIDRGGARRPASGALAVALGDLRARLSRCMDGARGFAEIAGIDWLDGIRVSFRNRDIAHVRPSGNAPQLRIYAVADSAQRSSAIVDSAVRPDGVLADMMAAALAGTRRDAIVANVDGAQQLFRAGAPAAVIGAVAGSETARQFWQVTLERAQPEMRARAALALHEDLPVNQALGILLLWQRIRDQLRAGEGALIAFVFGEGTRATPLSEAESAQKAAMAAFVRAADGRYLSMVELAMRHMAPVEAFLRRSGFDGIVVKWGDEVQIAACDLAGSDARFAGADVVRFVSVRPMSADTAANKDWVGVDRDGRVTAFIPRRPLAAMYELADRGWLQRRGDQLIGGINLGSIALSRAFLDVLLDEFAADVNDPAADRRRRPDLDPQFFTALTIAVIDSADARDQAWAAAVADSGAMRALDRDMPGLLARLVRAVQTFRHRHGRAPRLVAMDLGEPYWGDVGQHRQMYDFYMALNDAGPPGDIARALVGVAGTRDRRGNLLVGTCRVSDQVHVRNSVLIDCELTGRGAVIDSVLVGTRAETIVTDAAFSVLSTAVELHLGRRAGSYRVIAEQAVVAEPGQRLTSLFMGEQPQLMRVHEDTDLRDRQANYEVAIVGNPVSFAAAHRAMAQVSAAELQKRRERALQRVLARLTRRSS
jgi:phosphomannomutase